MENSSAVYVEDKFSYLNSSSNFPTYTPEFTVILIFGIFLHFPKFLHIVKNCGCHDTTTT